MTIFTCEMAIMVTTYRNDVFNDPLPCFVSICCQKNFAMSLCSNKAKPLIPSSSLLFQITDSQSDSKWLSQPEEEIELIVMFNSLLRNIFVLEFPNEKWNYSTPWEISLWRRGNYCWRRSLWLISRNYTGCHIWWGKDLTAAAQYAGAAGFSHWSSVPLQVLFTVQ